MIDEIVIDIDALDWTKMDGLIPAIVQDAASGEVRMLGYMDRAALEATIADRLVTFHSRSRGGRWRKGEMSGNLLDLVDVRMDCDGDALLVLASARGPTCHSGSESCFGDNGAPGVGFVGELERIVAQRASADPSTSYTARLLSEGPARVAQKVGEEGVETALAGRAGDNAELAAEAADLVYHLTVLLRSRGLAWDNVVAELKRRHRRRIGHPRPANCRSHLPPRAPRAPAPASHAA
ncbi:MAG: bifunctional phosphoribosyl-AMP cyclohydrolase/phosphoribosyl-ATP diphosphatase HisIE [Sphingomonadales bacterium]|nr:bifunctional phosphoribosyl-AMP cyclohydrolase/phosphoribosyl-ATP diphosphatase HisIE [Sphingomonadales bacterium]